MVSAKTRNYYCLLIAKFNFYFEATVTWWSVKWILVWNHRRLSRLALLLACVWSVPKGYFVQIPNPTLNSIFYHILYDAGVQMITISNNLHLTSSAITVIQEIILSVWYVHTSRVHTHKHKHTHNIHTHTQTQTRDDPKEMLPFIFAECITDAMNTIIPLKTIFQLQSTISPHFHQQVTMHADRLPLKLLKTIIYRIIYVDTHVLVSVNVQQTSMTAVVWCFSHKRI